VQGSTDLADTLAEEGEHNNEQSDNRDSDSLDCKRVSESSDFDQAADSLPKVKSNPFSRPHCTGSFCSEQKRRLKS